MVRKFAYKLLKAARDSKDKELMKVHSDIEHTLITKMKYLDAVRRAKPAVVSKKSRNVEIRQVDNQSSPKKQTEMGSEPHDHLPERKTSFELDKHDGSKTSLLQRQLKLSFRQQLVQSLRTSVTNMQRQDKTNLPKVNKKTNITRVEAPEVKELTGSAMSTFVNTVLSLRSVPLPIFQKITSKKEFIMYNYAFNLNLFVSLSSALPKLIPTNITKMYLINNNLTDESHQDFFDSLQSSSGLRTLVVAKNAIGYMTTDKIAGFIRSQGFLDLRKFVIKDPVPSMINTKQV